MIVDNGHMTPAWKAAGNRFLDQLQSNVREAFLSLGKLRLYKRKSQVFRAGVRGKFVYLVETGWVKIHQVSPKGKDVILWFCGPGEIFGLAGLPREVFAEACTETKLRCIARDDFLLFLKEHPEAALNIVELLLGRLYVLSNAFLQATTESKKVRLIHLLLHLAYQHGRQIGLETCIDIPLTEQDFASMVGTSRQTISKQFSSMKKEGILRVSNRRIHLNNERLKIFRLGE